MLRSVGVDPRHVPVDADFSRKGDLVRFDKYVLADDGCLLVGPDGRLPLTEEVSIRPSAHLVPDWIPLDRH